jgi:protein ImuA
MCRIKSRPRPTVSVFPYRTCDCDNGDSIGSVYLYRYPVVPTALAHPEHIHPSLWRAAQLARGEGRTVDTGYPPLSRELPGGGWPRGALVELLLQQSGIGELRLLAPALASLGQRPVALLQPPQEPSMHGLSYIGLRPETLLMIRARNTSDTLWSAEQVLKTGSCDALLIWQQHVRADSLRRLHLAARSGETLLFMFRPLASALDASPAELRLGLRPDPAGISVEIIKRKGPSAAERLIFELKTSPVLLSRHGRSRRPEVVASGAEMVEA